jgi:hypothetical protein
MTEKDELKQLVEDFHLLLKFLLAIFPILGILAIIKYVNEVYFRNLLTFVGLTIWQGLAISVVLQYILLKL